MDLQLTRAVEERKRRCLTSYEGRMVALDHALEGCERILNDEFTDRPERALYMIGGIEEVR